MHILFHRNPLSVFRHLRASRHRSKPMAKHQWLWYRRQKQNHGQSLVEYLVLTCLVAVAAISVLSVVGRNIQENYSNISNALRGSGQSTKFSEVDAQSLKPKGFHNYMENAGVDNSSR